MVNEPKECLDESIDGIRLGNSKKRPFWEVLMKSELMETPGKSSARMQEEHPTMTFERVEELFEEPIFES